MLGGRVEQRIGIHWRPGGRDVSSRGIGVPSVVGQGVVQSLRFHEGTGGLLQEGEPAGTARRSRVPDGRPGERRVHGHQARRRLPPPRVRREPIPALQRLLPHARGCRIGADLDGHAVQTHRVQAHGRPHDPGRAHRADDRRHAEDRPRKGPLHLDLPGLPHRTGEGHHAPGRGEVPHVRREHDPPRASRRHAATEPSAASPSAGERHGRSSSTTSPPSSSSSP